MKINWIRGVQLSTGAIAALMLSLSAAMAHQRYRVVVLPPDGGADSFEAGYLFYAPLNERGTVGVAADTDAAPGALVNSYTWTDGRQTPLQQLPAVPDWVDTNSYINWLNGFGVSAGYITRTNSSSGATADSAMIWLASGRIFDIQPTGATQSHAVWINGLAQVSGWFENSVADPQCSFGNGEQTMGFIWEFGVSHRLGTLGGVQSYGEFINDRGQISGHAETSTATNPVTGCPPYDPFVWQAGKMTDMNPGNFGGAAGGTNFLSNGGYAVGYGTTAGEASFDPFLWHEGKATNLNTIGSLGGAGSGFNVNDIGHAVGVNVTPDGSVEHAVLWRDDTFTDLLTLPAYDCSEAFRINNHDQIVGFAFSCETGASSAFIWEDGEMVDLNALIPADSGLQLLEANWINGDGVISAQAVLTAGGNSGDSRAVLLIPAGICDPSDLTSPPVRAAVGAPQARAAAAVTAGAAILRTADGRIDPMWMRPVSSAQLRRKLQQGGN
jgi:probable HAF family extracellular repeat protein